MGNEQEQRDAAQRLRDSGIFPMYSHFDNQIWGYPAVSLTSFSLALSLDASKIHVASKIDHRFVVLAIFLAIYIVNIVLSFIMVKARVNQKPFKYYKQSGSIFTSGQKLAQMILHIIAFCCSFIVIIAMCNMISCIFAFSFISIVILFALNEHQEAIVEKANPVFQEWLINPDQKQ